MKRLFIALISIYILIGSTTTAAQTHTSVGIKAAANMSNFAMNTMRYKSGINAGANFGGFVKIEFNDYLALQPEMLVYGQNSIIHQGNDQHWLQYYGMEIPVYALGQFPVGENKCFFAGIGVSFRYGFSAKDLTFDKSLYSSAGDPVLFIHQHDFGLSMIIGYEFKCRFQINASYEYGLTNLLVLPEGNEAVHNQMISVGIGYRF